MYGNNSELYGNNSGKNCEQVTREAGVDMLRAEIICDCVKSHYTLEVATAKAGPATEVGASEGAMGTKQY
jgi:hypothetical protein